MNKMRHLQPAVMGRRSFFSSIAGLAASLLFGRLPFLALKVPAKDKEFVIINGWVLTREDVAASKVTSDVV
jgi:hypothetical protein